MKSERAFFIQGVIFGIIFLLIQPGFSEVKKEDSTSYSGFIDEIAKDFRSISVNERTFFISRWTKVIDGRGNPLTIYELKKGSYVSIKSYRNPSGSLEIRIVVEDRKGVR